MEVVVAAGPTLALKTHDVSLPLCLQVEKDNGFCFENCSAEQKERFSEESSSLGEPSESSVSSAAAAAAEEEEEVQSGMKQPFGSLDSLAEALPIKRGLSSFFSGKSKSFACLSDVVINGSLNDLVKPEHPFNKRRRILVANNNSWARRASYTSVLEARNEPYAPSLAEEQVNEEEEEEERDVGELPSSVASLTNHDTKKPKRTFRSFSLSDLQHA